MMVLYRVSRAKYAKDLSGEGARLAGARWNNKGTPIIYTAEARSLAVLEALVHMTQPEFLFIKRKMVLIEIPKSIIPQTVDLAHLPRDWRSHPPPFTMAEIGTEWAASMKSLLLRVPSAVVPEEFNMLINPLHPDMKSVKIVKVEDLPLDDRLEPSAKRK